MNETQFSCVIDLLAFRAEYKMLLHDLGGKKMMLRLLFECLKGSVQ